MVFLLEAVEKYGINPGLRFFAEGRTASKDPWRGHILCFFGAIACVLIAQLNTIGEKIVQQSVFPPFNCNIKRGPYL